MKHGRMLSRTLHTLIWASALTVATQASAAKDDSFIKKAAEGGLFEVQAAQLAEQNASSDQVKQLAQKIATDHQQANDQLKQIASTENVTLPTEPANKRELKKLSGLKGEKFDKEYVNTMVKDHKKDLKDFQKEAQKGKDSGVKNFASQTIPTLQQHLQMAEQAQAQLKQSATGSGGTGGKSK